MQKGPEAIPRTFYFDEMAVGPYVNKNQGDYVEKHKTSNYCDCVMFVIP
jgi:hypothetical protein